MKIIFIVFLLASFTGNAFASVTVIANSAAAVAQGDVKSIFTGDKMEAGGQKLTIVDNKAAIGEFTSKALGMDEGKYTTLWAKKGFRDGVPTPKQKGNDAEVIDFVKSTPGGIGYITGAAPGGVKSVGAY